MPRMCYAFILRYFQDSPEFLVLLLICFILMRLHWTAPNSDAKHCTMC